nr:28S ribosomal protein S29, mitochondrial-like [Oncorhynchus nerka]
MVRQPALELISHLKRADYSKSTLRYLLYGVKGSGKTMSLCHTVHYCSTQGWLVLHIPDAHLWVKNCKELLPSSYHASRFDQPIQASNWLRNFRTTNEHFLSKVAPPPQIDSGCQVQCQSKVWTHGVQSCQGFAHRTNPKSCNHFLGYYMIPYVIT